MTVAEPLADLTAQFDDLKVISADPAPDSTEAQPAVESVAHPDRYEMALAWLDQDQEDIGYYVD